MKHEATTITAAPGRKSALTLFPVPPFYKGEELNTLQMAQEEGCRRLAYAVIQQGVDDVKDLKASNTIKDGAYAGGEWPQRKNKQPKRLMGYFTHSFQVDELLAWFTCGHVDDWLDLVGSKVTARTICEQLEITAHA